MSTFTLSGSYPEIPVIVANGIDLDEERLMGFKAFRDWQATLTKNLALQGLNSEHTFHSDPWVLKGIRIHSVTIFPTGKIGFMTVEALLRRNQEPNEFDRVVFLRGGSVGILMILRPKDVRNERYVILVEQPRIGACGTSFLEIPAGMLDDSDEITGKAIEEIQEETGLTIQSEELIDMTKLALEQAQPSEHVQDAMYTSPANLDEFIPLLLWEKELDRKEIEWLKGRLTGARKQSEMITLTVRDYEVLWKEGARDAKTLGAWALYEGLNRSGKIEERLQDIRMGRYRFSSR